MLQPLNWVMADVNAKVAKCHIGGMTDVVAIVADGIAT